MSQTLKNITLMAALGEISQRDAYLQDFALKTTQHNTSKGNPFRDMPEAFTDAFTAERLDIIKQSKGGAAFSQRVARADISHDLDQAGIKMSDLSRAEQQDLKVTKIFFENFHSDSPHAFSSALANARENLYGHLQGQRNSIGEPHEGRRIPPTVLYSMAFGNGRGVGKDEPSSEQLIEAMYQNQEIMACMDKVVDAHDQAYKAQGMMSRAKVAWESLTTDIMKKPLRALAYTAAGAGAAVVIASGMSDNIYSELNSQRDSSAYTLQVSSKSFPSNDSAFVADISVRGGQTASELASSLLKAVDLPPTTNNISEMLNASNLHDPDRILANTVVSLKLPLHSLTFNQEQELRKVADHLSYGGARIQNAYIDIGESQAKSKFLDEVGKNNRNNDMSI